MRRTCLAALLVAAASVAVASMPYDRALYDVEVRRDLVYGVGATDGGNTAIELRLDLYRPIACVEPRMPVLLTIHGGGFRNGSKGQQPHVGHGQYFAARGFAVVSIDYRLEGDRPPADPEAVARGAAYDPSRSAANHAASHAAVVDTKTALRWIHAHASAYGFDPARVFAVGSSAGGYCAVVAGITDSEAFAVDLPGGSIPEENHPTASCALAAIVNLWGAAGPWLQEIDPTDPPMMLVYGTEDWLYTEGEAIRSRCVAVGARHEWFPLAGYGHGAWAAEIDGLPREEAILRFLERADVLTPPPGLPLAVPWGAMYTPNEHLTDAGMTGAVVAYRGTEGATRLLDDLRFAQERGVRLLLTLGPVRPGHYLDADGVIDQSIVRRELEPFFDVAQELRTYIEAGTVWGVRFMDEPHNPSGYAPPFRVDPQQLGDVFSLIRDGLGEVRVGSTAPPWYMIQVSGAGYASGQCVHGRLPAGFEDPIAFHRAQATLASDHGLAYVASLNANTNPADNLAFMASYLGICAIPEVDFVTSWQWSQGGYPEPCFAERLADPDPSVQAIIREIGAACARPPAYDAATTDGERN